MTAEWRSSGPKYWKLHDLSVKMIIKNFHIEDCHRYNVQYRTVFDTIANVVSKVLGLAVEALEGSEAVMSVVLCAVLEGCEAEILVEI